MKILDLRSRRYHLIENLWRYWDRTPGPVGRLLSALAGGVVLPFMRHGIDSRGEPPRRPTIVAVGNLRVGGTGKTPVTVALARELAAHGVSGAILTRGYGSPVAGPRVVSPADARCGDEARMMAAALDARPWRVYQARRRIEGLAAALADRPQVQVVLVEDGHQTAKVPRHLDALILDRWRLVDREGQRQVQPLSGLLLPWGPYRESARGAERAAVWLVDISDCRGDWPPPPVACVQPGVRVLAFARRMSCPALDTQSGPWAVVSGIGRPAGFERGCRRLLVGDPVLAVRCDDHCRYDAALVARIVAEGRCAGVRGWLTTAKDHVKLQALWPHTLPLLPVTLAIEWQQKETLGDLITERLLPVDGRS